MAESTADGRPDGAPRRTAPGTQHSTAPGTQHGTARAAADGAVLGAAQWDAVRELVRRLDARNGDGPHETATRLLKLTEECGEVARAYIGAVGQNPRKGVTHTRADVADELCDVIVTAAVALFRFADDPAAAVHAKVRAVLDRSTAVQGSAHAAGVPAPQAPAPGPESAAGR